MKKIIILASGNGSNAQAIINYFTNDKHIKVAAVLSNKGDAKVLLRAKEASIPALSFNRFAFAKSSLVIDLIQQIDPDLIVLAGFLWKIPPSWVTAFPHKIINIHPALLPAYGGKGMYGSKVHEAVIANQETESGITIHYVNEQYDEGAIIGQYRCEVKKDDSAADLAQRIHQLEHAHYPELIAQLLD